MSKISDGLRYYFLVAGVGLLAASAAIALYVLYQQIWRLTTQALSYSILLVVPFVFLSIGVPYVLVRRFAKTKTTGSGTHTVLEAYHLTNGDISIEDTIVKPAAGMITIGLGGSAGPEGPSLLAGGGVAAAVSRRFNIQADMRRRLFIAAAAAGLAATFRTPLTAILFSLEIPYKNDLDRETFIEAVVASVPAYLLSMAILGSEPFFGPVSYSTLNWEVIALSLLLGLICGLYSVFFTKTFDWMGKLSVKVKNKVGSAGLVCTAATFLSISGVLSLYTIGVGLNFTGAIISGATISIAVLVAIILLKTFATAFTLNFGGSGGLFFPTIVIGSGIGYIFAQLFNMNYSIVFIAVGMAAMIGATHKVLLTPVAFIVETLGGLVAIPALLANVVAYIASGKHSFYSLQPRTRLRTEALALERFFLRAQKVAPEKLKTATAADIMTKNPIVLAQGSTIKQTVDTFEGTKLRVLPVVDEARHVVGVVTLEDLGFVDLRQGDTVLSNVIFHKPLLVKLSVNIEDIAKMMMEKAQDHVFVVNDKSELVGVVSGIDEIRKMINVIAD